PQCYAECRSNLAAAPFLVVLLLRPGGQFPESFPEPAQPYRVYRQRLLALTGFSKSTVPRTPYVQPQLVAPALRVTVSQPRLRLERARPREPELALARGKGE